jgi:hypothetical protein
MNSMSKCNSEWYSIDLTGPRLLLHSQIFYPYKLERHVHHVMINVQTVNSNDDYSFSRISQPVLVSSLDGLNNSHGHVARARLFGATTSRLNPATLRQ